VVFSPALEFPHYTLVLLIVFLYFLHADFSQQKQRSKANKIRKMHSEIFIQGKNEIWWKKKCVGVGEREFFI
jgi:hypothetical protein